MPRRMPRLTALIGVATLMVVLTGCFSIESTFTVNDDGTADVTYLVLIDTERLEQLSELVGEDMGGMEDLSGEAMLDEMMGGDDPCGDLEGDLSGFEVSTTEIDDDGKVGVECTVSGVPLEQINSSMNEEDATFTIEQDDDGTRFSATLGGVDELAGEDSDEMTSMLGMEFDELFSIVFTVSAPGTLGENNASSTDGSVASWQITPDAQFVTNGDAVMNAEWTPGGGSSSSSALWIILGIVGVAIVIGLIVFLVKRGKSGDGSPAGSPDGDAALTPAATPPAFDAPPTVATSAPDAPSASPPPPPVAPPPDEPQDVPPAPPAPPMAPPPPPPPS